MAANMYRVGDYVYFETSSTTPYQIRRIEELNKTPNGNVEAKVMCFYRRRDISSSLILLADKHQTGALDGLDHDEDAECPPKDDLTEKQRHQLKHRELFLSRQVETLPATHIRGKCAVTLLNETESLLSYLNKEDAFFYSLVYDPQQKTLLADKGEIRVGSKFQAEITHLMKPGETDGRNLAEMERLMWSPEHPINDKQIDQFMVIARSVGTFARALDCTSTVRQPSLHMSAAAASRDITLYHAMEALHRHDYNVSKAISSLVPSSGPVLCRDEMEEWSASEANLFEEALDKYSKDFTDIRQDFLPWKSLKSIVEYYYMWKTTDRYVQQKRIKAAEAESKLKQVYIPNYNKPNPAQITDKMNGVDGIGRACESCRLTHSNQWYAWGPVHMQCRLCALCWIYWKKYGGLKTPTRLDGERPAPNQRQGGNVVPERLAQLVAQRTHKCTIGGCGKEFRMKAQLARHLATAHGLAIQAGRPGPVMKTRAAFCLVTTELTRISRQVCKDILRIRSAAKQPFQPINIALIKQECQARLPEVMKSLKQLEEKKRGGIDSVSSRRGIDIKLDPPALLLHTKGARCEPPRYAFPLKTAEEMSAYFSRQKADAESTSKALSEQQARDTNSPAVQGSTSHPSIMNKRGFDQSNGVDGPPAKRPTLGVIRQAGNVKQAGPTPRGSVINHLNGREGSGRTTNLPPTRNRKALSWMDAPDDVYFVATDATRKLRKQMGQHEFKRTARKPWRKLGVKTPFPDPAAIVILD